MSMFNIDDLTDADIGRKVVYRCDHSPPEVGVITSWNHRYVFVRFKGPTGEACDERDLEFEFSEANLNPQRDAKGADHAER